MNVLNRMKYLREYRILLQVSLLRLTHYREHELFRNHPLHWLLLSTPVRYRELPYNECEMKRPVLQTCLLHKEHTDRSLKEEVNEILSERRCDNFNNVM